MRVPRARARVRTRQGVISVRGAVISHLRLTPTRAEITAARPAAHRLAASGQAMILHVRLPGFDGPGSAHLALPDRELLRSTAY